METSSKLEVKEKLELKEEVQAWKLLCWRRWWVLVCWSESVVSHKAHN